MRYTRGRPLLWSVTYGAGRVVNGANRAAQDFDPADRSAVNWVELFGPDAYVAAKGTYEPQVWGGRGQHVRGHGVGQDGVPVGCHGSWLAAPWRGALRSAGRG